MAIDGKWKVITNTPMGAQEGTADLQTSGGSLTGTVTSMFGDVAIEDGKVDGDEASWTLNITSPMAMSLKHKATFSGDTVKGEVELGMFGKSTFTGTRL